MVAEKEGVGDTSLATKQGTKPLPDLLKWLGNHRDGFLVAGAVVYGLGYLVWSYNAWKSGRGVLPAPELQYFVAGIVPAIILGVAWAAISFFFRIRDKLFRYTEQHRAWSIAISSVLLAGSYILVGRIMGVGESRWWDPGSMFGERHIRSAPLVFLMLSVLMPYLQILALGVMWHSAGMWGSKVLNRILALHRYVIVLLFILFSFTLYLQIYPNLPQQLGGPEPRCAYIDIVLKGVSEDTLNVLVPPDVLVAAKAHSAGLNSNETQVVRSKPLQVFFSSNDYLLVRPRSDEAEGQTLSKNRVLGSALLDTRPYSDDGEGAVVGFTTPEAPLYELKKEVIRVVTWCK